MAHHRGAWRPRMTRSEYYRGWVFFALYFLVFPFLMGRVQRFFGNRCELYLPVAESNMVYYFCMITMIFFVFWGFLRHGVEILADALPENLFAMGSGLLLWLALQAAAGLIPLPVQNPVLTDYAEQFSLSPSATVIILVVLWPVIEEVLFRGLVFGGLRRHSRLLAYALSIGLFALFKSWQFVFASGGVDLRFLLLSVQYLPMAAALTWCYDNGGSIWSAILLHTAVNGILLFAIVR